MALNHKYFDDLFTTGRRALWHDPEWRQGSERAYIVFTQAFDAFQRFGTILGKSYADIGCGIYSPFGVSALMYLNGVDTALAFDIRSADRQRSAEALYDLLAECALRPDHWHKSEVTREDFFERLYSFDYEALKAGDPAGGIASTGLTYLIGDIHEAPMKCDSFDLVSSRATLEHFLEFDRAMDELYRIMTPGAVSFHSIDLADHRVYRDPTSFNRWSFLTDESWIDPLCNRLRASEIIKTAESSGFKVDVIGVERISLPQQIRAQLDGRFGRMGNEDLETVSLECVFRKGVNL